MKLVEKIKDLLKKEKITTYLLSFILIFVPFISAILYIVLTGEGLHLKSFIPQNINDEFGWWMQINAVVTKGKPLGYWGYNESSALIGNFGSWSILTYYIYGIVGKIIGWNFYSMVWANLILLSFSLVIFIILVKPTNKQKIAAFIAYLICGAVTIRYSVLSMSESCRCSIGIIMISLIIYLIRNEKGTRDNVALGIIISILCFVGVSIYYPLIIFCFFLYYFLFKKRKRIIRLTLSLLLSILVLLFSFKFNNLFKAPYFDVNNLDILLETLRNTKGIIDKIGFVINFCVKGFNSFFATILDMKNYHAFYIFPMIVTLVSIVEFVINKKNRIYMFIAVFSMIGFLFGNVLLYESSSIPKLVRILSSLYLPIYLMLSQTISNNINKTVIILSTLLITPKTIDNMKIEIKSQYTAASESIRINELKDHLSKYVFEINEKKSEWENTIDIYGYCNYARTYMLALPNGCGMNTMYEDVNPYLAKYALVEKGFAAERQLLEQIPNAGFYQIFENDKYYIFRSMKYD